MSRGSAKIHEADLLAYVDGVLDEHRRSEVEAYLSANPESAETVEAWQRQNGTIRELYGHVAEEAVPTRLDIHRIAERRRPGSGSVRLAAAAAVLLALGVAGGWFARDALAPFAGEQAVLVSEAMAAHRLYSSEVVHPVEVAAPQEAHLATWLSKRLDRPLNIPDLRSAGFDLVGGRLLPAGGRPAAQFMYEDASGLRVTLYIVPTPDKREMAFRYASSDRLHSFYWRDAMISCALVGDLPREQLRVLALDTYRQLE